MEALITINNQQFYYAEIPELVDFSSSNKCAVIIDENKLEELLKSAVKIGSNHVNQIIVITDNLNAAYSNIKNSNVFIISAHSLEQAVQFAVFSAELSQKICCISKIETSNLKEVIESVME